MWVTPSAKPKLGNEQTYVSVWRVLELKERVSDPLTLSPKCKRLRSSLSIIFTHSDCARPPGSDGRPASYVRQWAESLQVGVRERLARVAKPRDEPSPSAHAQGACTPSLMALARCCCCERQGCSLLRVCGPSPRPPCEPTLMCCWRSVSTMARQHGLWEGRMATSKQPAAAGPSGPPQWHYLVGAIVAVGGLLWGVVSYFIPKPDPPKPAPVIVPAPAPASVSVTGAGAVGVGTMSGGSISVGAVPAQAAASATVTSTAASGVK
jgi:hypothetical protein